MFAGLRKHLTYANVVSSICLFVLLGGAAYAATALPRNSVGSTQLRNNAVSSAKVKDRSLLAKDFKSGQLRRGATGTPGKAGSDASSILTGRIEQGAYGGTNFAFPEGDTPGSGFATEASASELSPARAIVGRDLIVKESLPFYENGRTYALRVNGVDSALRCSIDPAAPATPGAVQCSDTAHGVVIPAGSTLSLAVIQEAFGGGPGPARPIIRFGWRAARS